jgi:hypothetical protein
MARGWESKSVEAQQDDAATARVAGPQVSRDEAARRRQRDTLMLARTKALADLQLACNPAHRQMLEQTIAELDRQLKAIE